MPNSEASLKARLRQTLRESLPGSVIFGHEEIEKVEVGIPDMSVTWNGRTTWIEGKYATPKIRTKYKLQTFKMMQLNATAPDRAIYVVWGEHNGQQGTFILPPKIIHEGWIFKGIESTKHFLWHRERIEHQIVVEYILAYHQ